MKLHRIILGVFGALSLGACSHMADLSHNVGLASPGLTSAERVHSAMALLESGHPDAARTELNAALETTPGDNTARRLLEQLDTDPRALLGERSRAYTVRADESMSTLAERFLGDPLLFYALARYNDMDTPSQLAAGQVIRIPERARSASRAAPRAQTPPPIGLRGQTAEPAAAAPPSVVASATAPPSVSAARANQLRLAGLEQLNQGAIDRAIALLRQAQTLDSSSAPIQRDLDRALRIQASLRSRPPG